MTSSSNNQDIVDLALPNINISDTSIAEGDSGVQNLVFTVNLSSTSLDPVTVDYKTSDGTAEEISDYLATSGTLTFDPGKTEATIEVAVVGDTLPELDEIFNINLSNETNAVIGNGLGIGTILNDDLPPPSLNIGDAKITEGNSGTQNLAFVVTLSDTVAGEVSVNYGTFDDTAVDPTDYLATGSILTFAAGQKEATIEVAVVGDTAVESDETFTVGLTGALGADIGSGVGVGTIINDDVVVLPTIRITDVALTEGNAGVKPFNFVASLSAASSTPVTVNFATGNGTAFAGSDYLFSTGIITFAAGQTLRTITANVVGDTLVEPNETFNVNLSGAVGATISDAQGVGTIVNDDVLLPKITISDVTLTEGNSGLKPFNFVVSLSSSSSTPVTVNFATANGTALAGSDYLASAAPLTFAPGQTVKTVTVNAVGDTLVEPNETFSVNLSAASGAVISDSQGVGTIVNDDVILPKITISDVVLTEGNSGLKPFNFVVGLSSSSSSPVSVKFATANGTAFAPSDYGFQSGIVTFAVGQTLRTISVNVVGDLFAEANETFSVNLSGATGAVISDSQGVGTIVNDDQAFPNLTVGDAFVTEGNSGFTRANFVVKLSSSSTTPVSVKFATANLTAFAGSDYGANTGILTFAVGQTIRTVSVNVFGDTLVEANETFSLNLSSASGSTIIDSQGIGTIINDDKPLPTLRISDVRLTEGNSGIKPFNFVVGLSAASTTPVSVKFATASGSAVAGSDFGFSAGTLTFAAGQTLRTVSVNVVGDLVTEADETFSVNLSGAIGATISDSQGIGTIVNDDKPLPSFSISDVALTEGNSGLKPFNFLVKLSNAALTPTTVKYATANGTAFAGSDYLSTSSILTFAAGQTVRTVSVNVVGDTLVEANEVFNVNLSGATGATISDSQGIGTIVNDDQTPTLPRLTISDVSLTEGNSGLKPFNFVVRLSNSSVTPVSVRYATANGTAFAGSDYGFNTGIITFATGQTVRTVSVNVVGDTLVEANETFRVNLSGAVGATISDTLGLGTIVNDDQTPTLPRLTISDVSLTEGNSGLKPFNFVVRLSNSSATPVSVRYATANGTAFAGSDYGFNTGIITFATGQTVRTVSVNVVGDTLVEANETFRVNLSGAVGATISDTLGLGTIVNDDSTVVKNNLQEDELLGRVKTITGTASSDTFTLGDASGAYYASNGSQDYALLVNFEAAKDRIQLHGSANDYQISKGGLGAEIFLNKTELIGVVVGVNQVDSLSLSFV